MPLVEFGKNNQISLWKHIPDNDGWEGYSYICPKCDFEVLQKKRRANTKGGKEWKNTKKMCVLIARKNVNSISEQSIMEISLLDVLN